MPRPDAPWSGRRATDARQYVRGRLPAPCGRCGLTITDGVDRWVVGHIVARSVDPSLTWVPSNWQPEHQRCSNRSSQSVVIDKARRDGALAVLDVICTGLDDSVGRAGFDVATIVAARRSMDDIIEWVKRGGLDS